MLVSEAICLAEILDRFAPDSILDIGSGSRAERDIAQPHIGAVYRGHVVVWTDLNPHPGVIQCDITRQETLGHLPRCEMVTACSILEHVTDIDAAMKNIVSLVDRWLVVAVPFRYPIHNFPIDNGWRPAPDELAKKVEDFGLRVVETHCTGPEHFGDVANAFASIVVAVSLKE